MEAYIMVDKFFDYKDFLIKDQQQNNKVNYVCYNSISELIKNQKEIDKKVILKIKAAGKFQKIHDVLYVEDFYVLDKIELIDVVKDYLKTSELSELQFIIKSGSIEDEVVETLLLYYKEKRYKNYIYEFMNKLVQYYNINPTVLKLIVENIDDPTIYQLIIKNQKQLNSDIFEIIVKNSFNPDVLKESLKSEFLNEETYGLIVDKSIKLCVASLFMLIVVNKFYSIDSLNKFYKELKNKVSQEDFVFAVVSAKGVADELLRLIVEKINYLKSLLAIPESPNVSIGTLELLKNKLKRTDEKGLIDEILKIEKKIIELKISNQSEDSEIPNIDFKKEYYLVLSSYLSNKSNEVRISAINQMYEEKLFPQKVLDNFCDKSLKNTCSRKIKFCNLIKPN